MNQSKENEYECHVCGDRLSTSASLDRHILNLHSDDKEWFKCPDCGKVFARRYDMNDHQKRKHGPDPTKFECQYCSKKFELRQGRDSHEEGHTKFQCPRNLCYKTFDTAEGAIAHAEDPDHRADQVLYKCPLSTCRLTVVGKVLKRTDLVKHWKIHQKQGHVSQDKELEYITAEQPRFNGNVPLFVAILKHNKSLKASPHEADNLVEEPLEEHYEDREEEGSRDLEEEEDDAVLDRDVDILRQNEEWWETHKDRPVCLNARGYECAGPGLESKAFILERCQDRAIIDMNTAILTNSRGRKVPTLSLDSRCVKCHAEMRMRQLTTRFDSPRKLSFDLGKLGDDFATAASKRWSCPPQYAQYETEVRKPVRDMRLNGQHTGPRKFVILDNEFNTTTRELYETAIIDRITGEVLINTVIRHTDATKAPPLPPGAVGQKMEYIADRHRRKFYPPNGELTQMDVDQVAEALHRSGITPETIFICWHNNKFDLTILREFLEKGGYTGIVPGDDKCFPLIPIFKKNVPKSLVMRLEVLFQVLYPAHSLIGHNHRALPDCQQTRLVCECLDEMFEKSDNRSDRWKAQTLRRFYKKAMIQQSIADWLQPDKKRNADSLDAKVSVENKRPRRQ
ncbi:hypothetical protein NOF04DRAFT_1229451 [Fusarium oxysporum II5]|uniref:C2H2-type domain-containing protein n=2 Tax=Fusarium oxysporum species complex TaxID=171631 RepID=A0A5C6T157_FUSOC|nr:hypothetical protein NOF04DRAFT_1229451 [Fusarium oxysporum II5]TXC04426.1 hypothetical protein FocTR4_00001762 [Fusarium oxysporum f. sp. cubense]